MKFATIKTTDAGNAPEVHLFDTLEAGIAWARKECRWLVEDLRKDGAIISFHDQHDQLVVKYGTFWAQWDIVPVEDDEEAD